MNWNIEKEIELIDLKREYKSLSRIEGLLTKDERKRKEELHYKIRLLENKKQRETKGKNIFNKIYLK